MANLSALKFFFFYLYPYLLSVFSTSPQTNKIGFGGSDGNQQAVALFLIPELLTGVG